VRALSGGYRHESLAFRMMARGAAAHLLRVFAAKS
jgi:hypothetical protein